MLADFGSLEEKGRYLDGAAQEDAETPEVRAVARAFVEHLEDPGARAAALYAFVRRRVRYIHDPGGEEFTDTMTVLRRGWDDCDGSARALVALALAAGLEACIRCVFLTELALVHFQALLRWPGSKSHPLADADGWVLCETTLVGVALGEGAEMGVVDRATGQLLTL